MPSLALDDHLIWFAHCPKAGGTSIEAAMVERWGDRVGHLHWGWDRWWRQGGWRIATPPNSPQHLIWEDALKALPGAPDAVFAIVRDPVARMISEYNYQRRHRRGTWLGRAVAHLPFSLWLRVMLRMAEQNPYAFDNHLRPHSDFIPEGAVVFRLEDGLEQVMDWLGVTAETGPPPHRLKSRPPSQSTQRREAALIGAVFAEDYARFGYVRPERCDQPRPVLDRLARVLSSPLVWLDRRGLV
ncbi:MAG: sulfotransferase family 2 domain-containing protein [Pseudomonadota bacterium]